MIPAIDRYVDALHRDSSSEMLATSGGPIENACGRIQALAPSTETTQARHHYEKACEVLLGTLSLSYLGRLEYEKGNAEGGLDYVVASDELLAEVEEYLLLAAAALP